MQYLNDPRPWTEGRDRELSMVDLVANETIPVGPAAMLWWALELGASLLTAGGPSGAGKSTLANACLSFLPDGARAYVVAGRDDPLRLPISEGPTYLLVSELSRHGRPHYISGAAARRVFALVRRGLRLVGTLHADSVDEALDNLVDDVELTRGDVAHVDIIAISRIEDGADWGGRHRPGSYWPRDIPVRRRIVEIGLLSPDPATGVGAVELAALDASTGRLEIAGSPAGFDALARWAGVPVPSAEAAIAERAAILTRLSTDGRRDPRDLDDAVRILRGQ